MPSPADSHSAAADLINTLTQDHARILQMFTEFEQLHDRASEDEKQTLVEIACTELVIHAEIEEGLLYPTLREKLGAHGLLDEALVEHMVARQLIDELEAMEPGDELYEARFKVLGEYVKHHIEEEQNEIFPLMLNAGQELESLREQLLDVRRDLRNEFGMPDEDYEEEDDSQSQQPAGPGR